MSSRIFGAASGRKNLTGIKGEGEEGVHERNRMRVSSSLDLHLEVVV